MKTKYLNMKNILWLEDLAKFLLANYAYFHFGDSWWGFYIWLFFPDISMLGYLINPRVGAYIYNIVHHQGFAILVFLTGLLFLFQELIMTGIILFGHSAMDRSFGYGLKHTNSFKNTHLGVIGKVSKIPKV